MNEDYKELIFAAEQDHVIYVDLHPNEPWVLCSLHQGEVNIWNYETRKLIKTIKICNQPIRVAKFVPRKNWVITGSDDNLVRVFNLNTLEIIHIHQAHTSAVRSIEIHASLPYILTSGDDFHIKAWNWNKNWECHNIYKGHSGSVTQIAINPNDNNIFASASLDSTLKVWQIGVTKCNFTLKGHKEAVNCVAYYYDRHKPYLVSGGNDGVINIWDYQNKSCIKSLTVHGHGISGVYHHPDLPILLSGSTGGDIMIWQTGTYKKKLSHNYSLKYACLKFESNIIAIGHANGVMIVKIGREEPAISMDVNRCKIISAQDCSIREISITVLQGDELHIIPLIKDIGVCEICPQSILHNSNGRLVTLVGDGEYIIYMARNLKIMAFGSAQDFVWASSCNVYAILEKSNEIKVFKNYKQINNYKPDNNVAGIFGGYRLGVKYNGIIAFYDWDNLEIIKSIEIDPRSVFWSENGDYVTLVTGNNYFILKYDKNTDDAFTLLNEVNETVHTGLWVQDCFIYTNSKNEIKYYIGGELVTMYNVEKTLYVLGYVPKENMLCVTDKSQNIFSYSFPLSVLEYHTAVMRKDFHAADSVLSTIPSGYQVRIAKALEKQGFLKQALALTVDAEHQFELALSLRDLQRAKQLILNTSSMQDDNDRWTRLGAAAMSAGDVELSKTCYYKTEEYSCLLFLGSSIGDRKLLEEVARKAEEAQQDNVAFTSYFYLARTEDCLRLLIKRNKLTEAVLFATTYIPSQVDRVMKLKQQSRSNKIRKTPDPEMQDFIKKLQELVGPVSKE